MSGQCCHSCPLHLGLRADLVPGTGQNPSCALSPWIRRLVGGELGIRLCAVGEPGSPLPNQKVPKPSVHHKPQSQWRSVTYSGKSCALTVTSGTHITLPSLSFFTCKMGIRSNEGM